MNKKNILKNLFLIIFSVVITLIAIEYFLKKNPTIFPNLGWQGKNLLQDQINNCDQNKKKIGVFGDSFVEFYGKSKINLVNMLNTKSNNYFCNFGLSGIDINDYINRFLYVNQKIKFDEVIFFIFEGNDFDEYLFNDEILKNFKILNKNLIKERKLNFFKNFVKSTYSLNLFYRFIYKKYIYKKNHINFRKIEEVFHQKKDIFNISPNLNNIKKKHEKFPKNRLKLLNSDILNRQIYFKSLIFPDYYKSLNIPNKDTLDKQKNIVDYYFNFLEEYCYKNKIKCNFIIIPEANFVSKKYKSEFHEFFNFDNNLKYNPKSSIVEYIILNHKNIYYPKNIFNYEDFIQLDGHLNDLGNDKLSEFVINKLY